MAFNYIRFIVAKQTQTIQSLFFLFCHHSVSPLSPSVLILPSLSLFYLVFCSHSAITQSLLPGHLYSVSPQTLFCTQSLSKSHTSVLIFASCLTSSHKMAKTQLIKYMESRIPHAKLGFATPAKCSTPTGKRSTKLHKKTHTMKRSFSMTSGDRTRIFMLNLLGLSSKHNKYLCNQTPVQQKSKEEIISPLEPLFHYCFNKRNIDLLICSFHIYICI